MAEITEYSNTQANAIREIIGGDAGFHTDFYVADFPFSAMLSDTENGGTTIQPNCEADITLSALTYTVKLNRSDERKCWFFTVTQGDEQIQGIVHFNVIYNAKGLFSFAFLNDSQNDGFADVSLNLPYSNFFVMRK